MIQKSKTDVKAMHEKTNRLTDWLKAISSIILRARKFGKIQPNKYVIQERCKLLEIPGQ